MEILNVTFIDNASHGYLIVDTEDIKRIVNDVNEISGFSGVRCGQVQLEEDCDLGIFLRDAKEKNIVVKIRETYNERFRCEKNYSPSML